MIEEKNINITHEDSEKLNLDKSFEELKTKIIKCGNLSHMSVKDQLIMLNELMGFSFGRFLVSNRGANAEWTEYLISGYPCDKKKQAELDPASLEYYLFNRSLVVLAHRDRFKIYKKEIQSRLKDEAVFASIPCGAMRDFLDLDFSTVKNYRLFGIDYDSQAIELARKHAKSKNLLSQVEFVKQDAWKLSYENNFDLITSSGLNVYERNPKKIKDLYNGFYKSLKKGGVLIISGLTFPPTHSSSSEWDLSIIEDKDVIMEQVLYQDILGLKWRNFKTTTQMKQDLVDSGFVNLEVVFDKRKIFPTLLAYKH